MRILLVACSIFAFAATTAYADGPPNAFKETYPQRALQAAWAEYQAVFGPGGEIPPKMKQLIALGVAANIPCDYCVLVHGMKARKAGATEAEIKEALAAAALVRKWSTVLNGYAYDMEKLKAELGIPSN